MARLRLPDRVSAGRRDAPLLPAPPVEAGLPTARDLLFRSWPGRIFLASTGIRMLAALLRQAPALVTVADILSTIAALGLGFSLIYFLSRLFVLAKRHLLWRVRRTVAPNSRSCRTTRRETCQVKVASG